jgi:hypothetical protein
MLLRTNSPGPEYYLNTTSPSRRFGAVSLPNRTSSLPIFEQQFSFRGPVEIQIEEAGVSGHKQMGELLHLGRK